MHTQSQFAELKYSKKIWAVGSIHSHFDSFNSIKEHILKHFVNGDKFVGTFKEGDPNGEGKFYYVDGDVFEGEISNEKIFALKPKEFMNLSGISIKKFLDFYKINMKNLLLVLLIFYGLSYNLFAQSDDRLKGLDSELEKVLKSLDEMGFAVAIVEKNKV